jgi:iron complex outermembrane recepter protein
MTLPHHASRDTGLRAYSLPHLTLATMMGVGVVLVAPAVAGVSAERAFDVPAGNATEALKRFAVQSGQQVVFMGDTVRGEKTRAVKGVHTPRQALELMLAGTRLQVVQDSATGALAVRKAPPDPNAPRAAPPVRKQRPPRPRQDQAVELSPFVVSSGHDHGYQAANTLAGSRLNTPLRDTPASISVLTDEFIRDVGALDLTEAIAFGNNVELDRTGGNPAFEFFDQFTIRGQAATVARNYFRWKLPTNTFNLERIEEARGPNAILFGFASAGGIISASTKQAQTNRDFRRLQLVYGSYDLRRATVDINQASFDGKLGVRFNAVASRTQGYQHYVFKEDTRGHLAVKFQASPATVIRAEYEKGRTFGNKADYQEVGDDVLQWIRSGRPLVDTPVADAGRGLALNSTAGNQGVVYIDNDGAYADWRGQGITLGAGNGLIMDPALVDPVNYRINLGGPTQTQAASFNTWSASVERRFGRDTFLQLAWNHQDYDFEVWQATNPTALKGDPNRFLRDGVTPNPHAGELYFETFWTKRARAERSDNFRLTASHEFNFGQWGEYRLAGLAEREMRTFYNNAFSEGLRTSADTGAFTANAEGVANRLFRRHYITVGDYATYYASSRHPDPATGTGFLNGIVDPGDPARTLNSRMVVAATSVFDDPTEQDSVLLSGQAYYLRRKLVIAGGYRTDRIYMHEGVRGLRNAATGEAYIDNVNNPRSNRDLAAQTKTLGAVYHLRPWLAVRYNRSNSLELPASNIRIMPESGIGSRVGDSPKGDGQDYGVDLNLLDGKIFIRATRFTTNRIGYQSFSPYGGTADNPTTLSNRIEGQLLANLLITQAERDLHRPNSGGCQLDLASSGYEFTVTANPTGNIRLQANYSVTDAVSSNIAPEIQAWAAKEIPYWQTFDQNIIITANSNKTIGTTIAEWQAQNAINQSLAGVAFPGKRREKVSGVAIYAFNRGMFQGLRLTGTVRHQGKQIIGATTAGQLLHGNSYTRLDAAVGYRFGRGAALKFFKNLSLQLNVFNVLNQHDPWVTRLADNNAAVQEVNSLTPQLPTAWRLSADLAF